MTATWQRVFGHREAERAGLPGSEVWQCPECRALGELVGLTQGIVQLKCRECGFVGSGAPAPNSDVE